MVLDEERKTMAMQLMVLGTAEKPVQLSTDDRGTQKSELQTSVLFLLEDVLLIGMF